MDLKKNLYYTISLIINYLIISYLWGIHYRFGDPYGMKQDAFLCLMFGIPVLFIGLIIIILVSNILIKKYNFDYLKIIVIGNIIFSVVTMIWLYVFIKYIFIIEIL